MGFSSIFSCVKGSDNWKNDAIRWRAFSVKELKLATHNFNCDNKLGQGKFGSVYWGQLWNGSQIAVRRFESWSKETQAEFTIEIAILASIQHKNLLSLRGYCIQGQQRQIVYDYMTNRNLLSHLHGHECRLDWTRRMNIAIGAAEGIAYLHSRRIIHRDIKASNILLDRDFEARVSDFRFAKFIPDGATHITTRVIGSLGYLAPEYAMFGKASMWCDVYSFGILLLELASGKKPVEKSMGITEWAEPLARQRKFDELADQGLNGNYVEEEVKRVVFVGLACIDIKPEKRPTMLQVVEMLKGDEEKLAALQRDEMFQGSPIMVAVA